MDPLFGHLIAAKVATLEELRTVYSLEDAHVMFEAVNVPRYNEWLANERAYRKAELRAK